MRATFFFLIHFFFFSAQAAYYDVLPKGVRNFTYRYIQTGKIGGSYNSSGDFEGYNLTAKINADSLKGINSAVDTYLNGLSAEDYAAFSFGTFEGGAISKVSAHAFGAGHGITNKITLYGFIPYYMAEVDLHLNRTERGRNNVGTTVQIEDLPDVDARLIQSLFVNYYNYNPLGKWEAKDFGDAELGAMIQLKRWRGAGLLGVVGVVAPTGRVDDPDTLQDIGFGDGQWDIFAEFGGGLRYNKWWGADSWMRYTYQTPFKKTVRLPESTSFPVTSRKGEVEIKLGNKFQYNLQNTVYLNDQFSISALYTLELKGLDNYTSAYAESDSYYEDSSNELSHIGRFNLGYSTVNLYKKKKFVAPLDINFSYQNIFDGKNIPKYDRFDLEFRLYF
ncbi:MAG: hypothetical protein Fur0010_18380 [Bdellovibrio sp.]